jgi:hypothetical protein
VTQSGRGKLPEPQTPKATHSLGISRNLVGHLRRFIEKWRPNASGLLFASRNAIERGYPVIEDWVAAYRSQATQNLRLASVAASTDADRNAVRLLGSELNNMNKLNQRFLDATSR